MASSCAVLTLAFVSLLRSGRSVIQEDQEAAVGHIVPLQANVDTLIYLQVAWRHGDRTPARSAPFNDESSWKEGLGELTTKGMAQQYRLGKWLRARYDPWLGNRFDRSEIFVRSSDYNRTLMSAQANMAGLFPPSKSEIWEEKLPWQPIPVHSVPKTIDKELYEDIDCPTASAEFAKIWDSEVVHRLEEQNKDLVQYLSQHSGIGDFEFRKLWRVYDNLFCMLQHNDTHRWPTWMNSTIFDRVQRLYDASSRLKYHTELLRRLRGGPLLKDIINRFEAKAEGTLGDKPKLYAYSAHDTTLAAMLSTMGIYPERFPLYASAVLLELHKKGDDFVVEVYHKNITDVDVVYHYHIPDCEDPCTLGAFKSAMERYLPDDWTAECGLAEPNVKVYMISTAVLSLTTTILASVLVLDVVLKKKRRRPTVARDPLMAEEEDA